MNLCWYFQFKSDNHTAGWHKALYFSHSENPDTQLYQYSYSFILFYIHKNLGIIAPMYPRTINLQSNVQDFFTFCFVLQLCPTRVHNQKSVFKFLNKFLFSKWFYYLFNIHLGLLVFIFNFRVCFFVILKFIENEKYLHVQNQNYIKKY